MEEEEMPGKSYEEANHGRNKRAEGRAARSRRGGAGISYDIRGMDWVAVIALTIALAEAGGACRTGLTRDGGALALGIYIGDDYATEYVRPKEDFLAAITEIAEAWLPENGVAFHQAYNELSQPRRT
jgi:hypothetical protein